MWFGCLMFRMGLVSLSARALFTFGVVALHFGSVFVKFREGIVYLLLVWFTSGAGIVYVGLVALHLAWVLFKFG